MNSDSFYPDIMESGRHPVFDFRQFDGVSAGRISLSGR